MNFILLGVLALVGIFLVVKIPKKADNVENNPIGFTIDNIVRQTTYDNLFKKYAAQYNFPWTWLKAIALNETMLGTDTYYLKSSGGSSDGLSFGLMQVTLKTASSFLKRPATKTDLMNDETSIKLASQLISQNIRLFGLKNIRYIIMGYNQNAYKLIGIKPVEIPAASQYFDRWSKWHQKITTWEAIK